MRTYLGDIMSANLLKQSGNQTLVGESGILLDNVLRNREEVRTEKKEKRQVKKGRSTPLENC